MSLLPVKWAVAVEQSECEALARNADAFPKREPLVFYIDCLQPDGGKIDAQAVKMVHQSIVSAGVRSNTLVGPLTNQMMRNR